MARRRVVISVALPAFICAFGCATGRAPPIATHPVEPTRPSASPLPPATEPDPAARSALNASIAEAVGRGASRSFFRDKSAATNPVWRPNPLTPVASLVRSEPPPTLAPVSGARGHRLPPQAVQRVLVQNKGRFRECYQRGLQRNPKLAGRVVMTFVIGADGRVWQAGERSPTLPDPRVRACVLNHVFTLSFHNPLHDTVSIDYPLYFSPDAPSPKLRLDDADHVADAPPPGFAEAYRAGRPAQRPDVDAPTRGAPAPARPSACDPGDPLCADGP